MKKILFWRIIIWWLIGTYSFAFSEHTPLSVDTMNIPFKHTISFVDEKSWDSDATTDSTYTVWTLLAEYVYPRSDGFASFLEWSCTEYVARQKPKLFLNENGSRRLTGNAEDRLHNAKALWMETGTLPKKWSIAVYYNGRWWRAYGHVAYVEEVQSNGVIIVSEMNYTEDYVVTLRAVDASLAAGYIY
jgi:hypothetical protein